MHLPGVQRFLVEHRQFVLGYLSLAPLYLAPLFVTPYLPAFDLPHHLAIVDALGKATHPDSPYARHFVVGFELAPFTVHLLVLRALAAVVSLGLAAKILVAAVTLTLPLATARLLHVAGRSTIPALLAFPLSYSMPLHYGLIAFVPALPLLMWMLAEAANENGWRARPLRHAAWLAVLSLVTFCTHLEAWAIGAAGVIVAVLLCSAPWRARVLGVASLAPSLAACLFYLARTTSDPLFASRPSFVRAVVTARLGELAQHGVLADLWDRVLVIPIHLLRGFTDGSDVVAARILLGLIATGTLAGLASWGIRRPRTLPRLNPVAGLVFVGVAAYFGLPHHAPPDAYSVYPRFAVVLVLLLLVVPARISSWPSGVRHGLAVLLVLLMSAHALNLVRHYAAFGRELADFEQVAAASPAGLISAGLAFDSESTVMNVGGIFSGVAVYYVAARPAPESATWLYYCDVPQLPCHRRHPERAPPLPHFSNPSRFDPEAALKDVQLVFVRGGPAAEQIFGVETPRVRLLAHAGRWRAFVRQ